jgi:hypothetical protein
MNDDLSGRVGPEQLDDVIARWLGAHVAASVCPAPRRPPPELAPEDDPRIVDQVFAAFVEREGLRFG